MSNLRKSLSIFLAVVMVLLVVPYSGNKLTAKAMETTVPIDNYAVVVGDLMESNGLGKNWDPTNLKGLMKTYKDGVFETTLDIKPNAKPYEYKVAMNGAWDESYGKGSGNYSLNVKAEQKVTFRLDYLNKKVYDSVNNPEEFKKCATLVGTLPKANWDPSCADYDLTYIGGGFYQGTFKLPAGDYEFKVAYNHAWSQGEVGSNCALNLANDTDVTVLANPTLDICVDSVNHPEILSNPSVIGTIRATGDMGKDINCSEKGFEFSPLDGKGLYAYSAVLSAKTYRYNVVNNYGKDELYKDPITLKVDKTQRIIVLVDEVNKKIYDSVNNPKEVATSLGILKPEVSYPCINPTGTVTFKYKAPAGTKSVYLEGDMTYWKDGKKLMTRDADGAFTTTLRVGDDAANLKYMFLVDGKEVADPSNINVDKASGHSVLKFTKFGGRKIVLAGTMQMAAGDAGNWDPAGAKSQFSYKGNGTYKLTIKDVPAGDYQYKIAVDGAWTENYGAGGAAGGSNINVTLKNKSDVSFTYNDDNHLVVDSINQTNKEITLNSSNTGKLAMSNDDLSGIYKATVTLKKGNYSGFAVTYAGKTYNLADFKVNSDNRKVKIAFDPVSKIAFTDIASRDINTSEVSFNSKDESYKFPYGATTEKKDITFNLKCAKDDLTAAKLVVFTKDNEDAAIVVDMKKNGKFDESHDKWSCTLTPSSIGLYKYYFVLSNGEQVKAYGDDDGLFGNGFTDDLGKVGYYDLNVAKEDYKTPDWLKNAVIYQIFPDRFFDGDVSNDTVDKLARGDTPYQFHNDWYSEPVGANDLFGGDLKGITAKLDYLKALGINTLYLNPISESVSSHRYDTKNYEEVDPFLGKLDDFVALKKACTDRGMNIILDSVYNHVSDDSIYFDRYAKYLTAGSPCGAYQYWKAVYDLMNTKKLSKADAEIAAQKDFKDMGITDFHYKDWFVVNNEILNKGTSKECYSYSGWNGNDSMPEIQALDGSEDNVLTWKDEILAGDNSNTKFWVDKGANGFRLDACDCVSDKTWRTFRDYVKGDSNNSAIVGEIWTDGSKYLLGDMWDSCMNYRYQNGLLDFLQNTKPSNVCANELDLVHEQTPTEAFYCMMNLVDSHDTARIATTLMGDKANPAKSIDADTVKLMKLVAAMQMTYPGAPTIYYGDELGMTGQNDPNCRRPMNWGAGNKDLVESYALMAAIRKNYSVLATGSFKTVDTTNTADVLSYVRSNANGDYALVAVNRGKAESGLTLNVKGLIKDGTKLYNAKGDGTKAYTVADGKVTVDVGECDALVLVNNFVKASVNLDALKPAYDSQYKVASRNYESAQQKTANSVSVVTDIKAKGAKTIDMTSGGSNANLFSVALEEGVCPTFKSGNVSLTLKDKKLAEFVNIHGLDALTFTAAAPTANIADAIKKAATDAKTLGMWELNFKASDTSLNSEIGSAQLSVSDLDSAINGKTVYLYTMDNATGKPVFVTSAKVADAKAIFPVKHLSTYFVTDSLLKNAESGEVTPAKKDDGKVTPATPAATKAAEAKVNNPKTGSTTPFAPVVVFFASTLAACVFLKKKHN